MTSFSAEKTAVVGSIAPATNRQALDAAADLPAGLEWVELRLDALSEPADLPGLRRAFAGRKLLATLRSAAEGGRFQGPEETRRRSLAAALEAGFDLVDVELRAAGGERLLDLPRERCVVSWHDPAGTPGDLEAIDRSLLATGAPLRKLVVSASTVRDALAVLSLQRSAPPGLSAFAMGEAGIVTRALSPYLGAPFSFGALLPDGATAPGQLPAADLLEVYGVGRPRRVERLFAVLGGRVSHSLSPALHNARFEALGLPALYVPAALGSLLSDLAPLVSGLAGLSLPLSGASVTIPFKEEAAIASVHRDGSVANTLLLEGDAILSVNTDLPALVSLLPPARATEQALVLGAGGTGRNAVEALSSRGYAVSVWARNADRALELAAELRVEAALTLRTERRFAVLVNATPLGLRADDPLPCPEELLAGASVVVDAPYRPGGTALATRARDLGARVVDGFALLAAQAALQSRLFTGRGCSVPELVASLPARLRKEFEVLQ